MLEGEELRRIRAVPGRRSRRRQLLPARGPRQPAAGGAAVRAARRRRRVLRSAPTRPSRAIERQDGGGFTVRTGRGTIRAARIVNAAGAWPNEVAALVGLCLPVRREGLHVNVTEPRERLLTPLVQHIGRRLTLKQSSEQHLHHRRRLAGARTRVRTAATRPSGRAPPATRPSPCASCRRSPTFDSCARGRARSPSPTTSRRWSANPSAFRGTSPAWPRPGFTLGPLMATDAGRDDRQADRGARSPLPR